MRTVTVNGVNVAGATKTDFSLVQMANQGTVGIGGMHIDDPSSATTIAAFKAVIVTEALATGNTRVFTGETGVRRFGRAGSQVVGTDRQWDVDLMDLNVKLGDVVFTSAAAARPEETDYARVAWLISTGRVVGLVTGVIPNTNTVTMPEADYRGETPTQLLDDCREASGKNFFVYFDGTDPALFYDLDSSTALTSPCRISNDYGDASAVTFAPENGWSRELDPTDIYSDIEVEFGQEPHTGRLILTNATTASNFKTRMKSVVIDANTADGAQVKAAQFLAAAGAEVETIAGLKVMVPSANVNDILAGQRIQIKLNGGGLPSFVYRRIVQRTVTAVPDSNDLYYLDLELMPKIRTTRFEGIRPKVILDSERIINGGFEFGPPDIDGRIKDWVVTSGVWRTYDAPTPATTAKPAPKEGKRALRAEQDTAAILRTEDLAPVEANQHYLFSGWALWNVGASPPTAPHIKVQWFDRDRVTSTTTTGKIWTAGKWSTAKKAKWVRFMWVFGSPDTARFRRIILTNPIGTAGRFTYFDAFSFHQTELTSTPPY